MTEKKEKKKLQINPFVLVFLVIVFAGIMTFIITPGTLEDGVYTPLPRNEVNFDNIFNIFRGVPYGLKQSANIMIIIMVVGGALAIYEATGAIDNGISSMVTKFGQSSQMALLIILMIVFSAVGGFLGWVETFIPFAPLVVTVVISLGFDAMTAVAVLIIGIMGGFMAGPTNLYTVGVANEIIVNLGFADPNYNIFTGLGFRIVIWVITTLIGLAYTMNYARKVKKDPTKSLVADIDTSDFKIDHDDTKKLTGRQVAVLLSIVVAMVLTVYGMQFGFNGVTWVIDDVSAIFLASGIFAGLVGGLHPNDIAQHFVKGAAGAIGGALIVGFARGVYWVLEAGQINATIIYYLTNVLRGTSQFVTAIGIILIVSLINGLVPSGSGKGALLVPILVPIGIELGLPLQTTVLAYQFGDGITNMFWFTFGSLLIYLSYGRVSIQRWWKFFIPLMIIYFLFAFASVFVALQMGF